MSIETPTRKNLSTRGKLVKTAAVLTLAAAATLAVPAVAQAYVPTVPGASVSSVVVEPGGNVTFAVRAGTFQPGETVTITLSGQNSAGANLATANLPAQRTVLGERTAGEDGSLAPARITLPSNAVGNYEVIATSPSVPNGVRAAFSVQATTVAGGDNAQADASGTLPATGMDGGGLLGVWVGGGALLLAGGAIVLGRAMRRDSAEDAS